MWQEEVEEAMVHMVMATITGGEEEEGLIIVEAMKTLVVITPTKP